jgi:hypothetical protein
MLFYALALLVLYMSMTAKKATLPHTPSHLVYTQMVDSGDDAKTFLELETALIEARSASQAVELSTLIKETYPDYDFGYHTEMITRASRVEHTIAP